MEHIFLPTTIEFQQTKDPTIGKVVILPCHQGYGTTIGNALRRVLLSSLPGAAVECVKIDGVQHEFSAIEGVQQDVIEVILNLKQLAVRCFSDEPVVVHVSKKGMGNVTAADIEKNSAVEIVNPDVVIATITDSKKTLSMDITIGKGRGYVSAAEKDTKHLDLGTIAIDSLYTPIRDVGYHVELTRVGDVTDYEKLLLTVATNGTITPREAIRQATRILMDHFALLLDVAQEEEAPSISTKTDQAKEDTLEEKSEEVAEKEATAEKPRTRKKKSAS